MKLQLSITKKIRFGRRKNEVRPMNYNKDGQDKHINILGN